MRFSTIFVPALLGLEAAALRSGPSTVAELNKRVEKVRARRLSHVKRDADPTTLYTAHNFSVPVDFFPNETRYEPHVNSTFNIRYWYDNTYYKPGGPVFVLLSGETSGEDRLPYLQKGIAHQVAEATGGLAVILEHRYYGTSFPVPNVTTENLRFLSTEQALADVDYFARNVQFEGIDADLTAPKTPWIAYGGSYAGAQAAFLRVAYPDTFWGTISSSGVTEAIYDYWEYFEPIRLFAPPDCIHNTQTFIDVLDNILQKSNSTSKIKELKDAFGLGGITDNRDFANVFTAVYGWQSTNWDPAVNSPAFYYYCGNISASLNFPELEPKRSTVQDLISAAGYDKSTQVENIVLNAIGYYGETSVAAWNSSGISQDAYFTQLNATYWQQTDLDAANAWRSWYYQVCTEYGFIQTGNTPANIKPIISRLLDLDYGTFYCGAGYNITTPPDLERVNKYGGFDIAYDRLAIIGGNADPWRPATPLHNGDATRNSTTERPWLEIAHAVHHWEENGLFPNETTPILPPNQIVYAQQFIADFVVDWVKEFNSKEHSEL